MTIVFHEYVLTRVLYFRYYITKVSLCRHLLDRFAIETQIVGIYAAKHHEFCFYFIHYHVIFMTESSQTVQ